MQARISPPMTPAASAVTIAFMARPGRRPATPVEFRGALAKRIKDAREAEGFSYAGIADRLTARIGREISADTYRKWETTESSIALDAILAFCDLTHIHPYKLLSTDAPQAAQEPHKPARRMTDNQIDRMLVHKRHVR